MKASRADGGGGSHRRAPAPPAATPAVASDFSTNLELLRREVRRACAREAEWGARVSAGIRAALEFAAANSRRARTLTAEGRGERRDELVEQLAEMLGELPPPGSRSRISTDRAIVGSILTIVRSHLRAGSAARLPRLAPDLVYLALMPYLGLAGARRGAEETARLQASGR